MKSVATIALLLFLAGCTQSDRSGPGMLSVALSTPASNAGNGSLAQAPAVTGVFVQVTEVLAHVASVGWILISDTPVEVDLLALPGAGVGLGLEKLPPGKVTQLRLLVAETGNRVVTEAGEFPLVVPSGIESGIKIQGPWEIAPCDLTFIALEFAGKKSVWYHQTGQGTTWILRPVIHVKKAQHAQTSCEEQKTTCVATSCASGLCDAAGNCAPGGAGTACSDGIQCLAGSCGDDGLCEKGGDGEPCREAFDCASDVCTAEGTCAPGDAGGTGTECLIDSDCWSNACLEGICGQGGANARCAGDSDCQEGYSCSSLACTAQ